MMGDDYKLLMLILDKNISEGGKERNVVAPPPKRKPQRKLFF